MADDALHGPDRGPTPGGRTIPRSRRLESRLLVSHLVLLAGPWLLLTAVGTVVVRAVLSDLQSPSIERAFERSATLAHVVLDRLRVEGERLLSELPEAAPPPEDEVWPQRPVEPGIALAWMSVALAEFNTGHIAEAEALMKQALVLDPHPAALALLGTIALRRGNYDDARAHLSRLGKLSDRFGDEIDRYDWQTNSKIGLAEVELFSGHREAGVTQLREALRQLNTLLSYPGLSAPLRAEFSLRRARVFFLLGEVQLGMDDAREAQRLAPERNDTISDPLMFTVVHGHLAEATELLTIALRRDDIGELGIYYALWVSDLAERLGQPIPARASEHLREFAADSSATAWQRQLASYGLGELSYGELAKLADDPRERSELYFYEGLRRWRSGSVESSLDFLRKVIEQQMMGDFEYQMAQSYLRWKELPKTARAALG
jgi:tetratricopeptide (TPR) repeat protein